MAGAVAHHLNLAKQSLGLLASMSEKDFECFASTGVNAPGTMFPNSGSRRFNLSKPLPRKGNQHITSELLVIHPKSRFWCG